jgi:hypothetical protein
MDDQESTLLLIQVRELMNFHHQLCVLGAAKGSLINSEMLLELLRIIKHIAELAGCDLNTPLGSKLAKM